MVRQAVLALTLVLGFCAVAHAQGAEIRSGQQIQILFEGPSDVHALWFEAAAGDLMTLSVTPLKKPPFTPEVLVTGPGGEVGLPPLKKGKLKASKIPLPADGKYFIIVGGADVLPIDAGYKLKLTLKPAKIEVMAVDVPGKAELFVPRGSEIKITVKPEKGSAAKQMVQAFADPVGEDLSGAGKATKKGLKKVPCEISGTHVIEVTGLEGTTGRVTVTVKRKLTKAAVKKPGEGDLVDSSVVKVLVDGRYVLNAWADGDGITSAWLVHQQSGTRWDVVVGKDFQAGPFASAAEIDAEYPDGLYMLHLMRAGRPEVAIPHWVDGDYPTPVTVTESTPTRVTWTGGAGTVAFRVSVRDAATGDDFFLAVVAGTATSRAIPPGLLPGAGLLQTQVAAFGPRGKMTLHGIETDAAK